MNIVGDCRVVLKTLPSNSVDCCVTSPPYWGLRDYGCADQIGLERTPDEYVAQLVGVFAEVRRVLNPGGTLWLNLGDTYATGAGQVLRANGVGGGAQGERWSGATASKSKGARTRQLRDGRHSGKHTAMTASEPMQQPNRLKIPGLKPKDLVGIPWRVAFALQADGWWLRSDVIWEKPNPLPESCQDRPSRSHEYLFLLTKSQRYFYDADAIREPLAAKSLTSYGGTRRSKGSDPLGKVATANWSGTVRKPRVDAEGRPVGANKRTVWRIAPENFNEGHFAVMPSDLVQPCILLGCPRGGTVLDPFMGSGTVGQVAENLGRRWIGIELNPEYARFIHNRTSQTGIIGI